MDYNDINELIDKIKKDQLRLQVKIGVLSYMTKVIVMGNTGCGKSSLTSCLSNRNVTIDIGPGDEVILKGIGIHSGLKSGTKRPCIKSIDYENKLIYCDCPGFIDTNGYLHEIKNAFIIDYLFRMCTTSNKCKFLLVVPATEFTSARGQDISSLIERMLKMFPNIDELLKGIGLVITKGKQKTSASDYLEILENNATDNVLIFCDFFKKNIDRVFTFPKAKRKKVGQEYFFEDKGRLIYFLQKDFVLNPITKIQVSEEAFLYIQNIKLNYLQHIKDVLLNIFCNIRSQYLVEKKQSEIKKWINLMNELLNSNIKNIKELKNFFKNRFQNIIDYDDDLLTLEKEESVNNLVGKVFIDDISGSILFKSIQSLTNQAILELNELLKQAIIKEKIEIDRQNIDQKMKELNTIEIENQKKQQDFQKMMQQKENDDLLYLNQQREIYERNYKEEERLLLNQLTEERRRNEINIQEQNQYIRYLQRLVDKKEEEINIKVESDKRELNELRRKENESNEMYNQLSNSKEKDKKCNIF